MRTLRSRTEDLSVVLIRRRDGETNGRCQVDDRTRASDATNTGPRADE
jgi:hypothetical protein